MKQFIALGFLFTWFLTGCGLGLRPKVEPDPISEGVPDGGSIETPDGGANSTADAGSTTTDGVDLCPKGQVLCAGNCVNTPLVPEECEPSWKEVKVLYREGVSDDTPVVYDIERKELLLITYDDLRSLVEKEWKVKSTSGTRMYYQRGVYRSKRKVAFLFGIGTSTTWEWNGFSWAQRSDGPPARDEHSLAYDSERDRVVLFGGRAGQTTRLSDTWEWDGAEWTEVKSVAGAPSARDNVAMAYDVARRKVVLFGGHDTKTLGDTWEYDGLNKNWTKRDPRRSPSARQMASMAYDPVRHRVVLFGGIGNTSFSDLWEWDGTEWTQRLPRVVPPARASANFVYDVHRNLFILVGGTDAYFDMWELSFP